MSGDAWIGLLFWLAILCYATGSGLVDSAVTSSGQAAGAVLMLGNSAIVVAIAVLLIPVVRRESEAAAWGYFAARLAEALLLALGVVFALTRLSVDEAGLAAALGAAQFFSYQVAMLALGLGSLPMCAALLRGGLLPAWLSIWGLAGYTALGAGAEQRRRWDPAEDSTAALPPARRFMIAERVIRPQRGPSPSLNSTRTFSSTRNALYDC